MNHLQKYISEVRNHLTIVLLANNIFLLGAWWYCQYVQSVPATTTLIALAACALIMTIGFSLLSASYLTKPLATVWQAVLHVAPDTANEEAPNLQQVHVGSALVTSLVGHLYQMASVMNDVEKAGQSSEVAVQNLDHDFIATSLPLPLLIIDKDSTIVFANQAMSTYLHAEAAELRGQNLYSAVDMAFATSQTFDTWLQAARASKAVAAQTWERVRLNVTDVERAQQPQFDLAAYYNKGNPNGFETMLVMFDHTNQYAQDDQAMSFLAIAVHELRTPLTLLRGYIEAFQEELDGKVDAEMSDFMKKMAVAAGQLTSFVNTILNVSRIDSDQLQLKLHQENWNDILQSAITTMRLRSEVRGIALELKVDDNLPAVGVDRTSITEVINNLIDNAIKYSGDSKRIIIRSYLTKEGVVETTVQDFGVGVPEAAVPHLFEKFYRNHRNRAQIGGTGLGLYLAKVIVGAHSGHIWLRSREGEGTTFGFTVLPYTQLAEQGKNSDNTAGIVRNAHGWIKNHSMYRR
jgi:signal transduction histidine kinase